MLKSVLTLPVDVTSLAFQRRRPAAYGKLPQAEALSLDALLSPRAEWPEVHQRLDELMARAENPPPTKTVGALNAGDRRALYHLIRSAKPQSVLEIGTHVGSSTVHIAEALRRNGLEGDPGELTTVDIIDVNAPDAPWARRAQLHSPRDMVAALGMGDRVTFRVSNSLQFLVDCQTTFDFVFLDGSHAAKDVYNELQMVQRLLRPGATLLLHDFFPEGKALWKGSRALPGPWLAYSRLRKEGAPLRVLPLGALPWPTKSGSNVTSLALVAGE